MGDFEAHRPQGGPPGKEDDHFSIASLDPAYMASFAESRPVKEVSMGGRFGKYGDAKRKAQIRKNRLRPPDFGQ